MTAFATERRYVSEAGLIVPEAWQERMDAWDRIAGADGWTESQKRCAFLLWSHLTTDGPTAEQELISLAHAHGFDDDIGYNGCWLLYTCRLVKYNGDVLDSPWWYTKPKSVATADMPF